MSIIEKMFGCCERSKTYKKCDIDMNNITITNVNKETANNICYTPCSITTKNTQIKRSSVMNTIPLITIPNSSKAVTNLKNDENEKTTNISIIKNLQKEIKMQDNTAIIHKIINNNITKNLRTTKTVICNRDNEKKDVISLSDLSFISEINEKENFSKLLLTGDLFFNKEIIINECGMINSKRNKKDGYTVFGLKNTLDITGKLNNDFIINFKKDEDEMGNVETQTGKVFEIIFNKESKEYTLYFINPYLYLYYKINHFVYFYPGKDYFLFVGKIFFSINTEKKGDEHIINIQVDNTCKENENPEKINQKYTFSSKSKPIIKIGRFDCDINVYEQCISKVHGIIEFSKINRKFYYKDMKSTNGTTLLVRKGDFLKIKGEMYFKLEDVNFKIQEIP